MKNFKKILSLFLAFLFVLQLFPLKYIGNFAVEAFALENAESITGYEFDIPKESDNTIDVDIPETFVDTNYIPLNIESEESVLNQTESNDQAEIYSAGTSDINSSYYTDSPYVYNSSESEHISLGTGSLTYQTVDYIIPGKNDFNLVIGRRYSFTEASLYKLSVNGNTINQTPNTFNDIYSLGNGWTFNFTSINEFNGTEVLYLWDGRTFILEETSNGLMKLSGQKKNEVIVYKKLETIYETGEEANYTIKYPDGRTEYLSSNGRIMYITDRYGNRIKFTYSSVDNTNTTTITDSLNQNTIISSLETINGYSVSISFPDGKYII